MTETRGRKPTPLRLAPADRTELLTILAKGTTEQRVARRACILVEMDKLQPHANKIAKVCGVDPASVWRVCRRYEERGLDCINDAPRPGRVRVRG